MTAQLPEAVDLNLDTAERPAAEVIPPFAVAVSGRRVVMTDPQEIDWQDLLDIENPVQFLAHCVNDADREFLRGLRIPGWKFGLLMEQYMKHYRIDEKVREAQREQARQQRF